MTAILLIIGFMLWIVAIMALWKRPAAGPAASFVALMTVSFAKEGGYPIVPVNNTMTLTWLAMTVIVVCATYLQSRDLRSDSRGVAYGVVGAITGMAIGLAFIGSASSSSTAYATMITATAAGTILGLILYSSTPRGRFMALGSGQFLNRLSSKGFPIAITVMQLGMAILLAIISRYTQ